MSGARAALRAPAFRWLTLGRVITVLGNAVAPIALAFAVLDLTGSLVDLGIVVGARSLMNVVFLLFGGVLADRLPRHAVMVGSSAVSMVSQGAVAALVLTGTASIPLLIALSTINGISAALAMPASAAVMPQALPTEFFLQGNALMRFGVSGANILGASVGGLVVASIGPGWGLAVDAVSFLFAGCCFAMIRLPRVAERSAEPTSVITELREGWTEFRSRRWVWIVVVAYGVINAGVTGAVQILGPAIADQTIGRSAWGLVLAADAAGLMLGALIAMRIRVRRLLLLGVVCTFALALLPLALAVRADLPVLILASFCVGLAMEQSGVAWETSLQQHIPADRLARVYSYDMVGSFVAIPLAEVAIGPIAHVVGLGPTLLGSTVLIVLATAAMLASRSVRRLEQVRPEPLPA